MENAVKMRAVADRLRRVVVPTTEHNYFGFVEDAVPQCCLDAADMLDEMATELHGPLDAENAPDESR